MRRGAGEGYGEVAADFQFLAERYVDDRGLESLTSGLGEIDLDLRVSDAKVRAVIRVTGRGRDDDVDIGGKVVDDRSYGKELDPVLRRGPHFLRQRSLEARVSHHRLIEQSADVAAVEWNLLPTVGHVKGEAVFGLIDSLARNGAQLLTVRKNSSQPRMEGSSALLADPASRLQRQGPEMRLSEKALRVRPRRNSRGE